MNRREATRRLIMMCHREGLESTGIAALLRAAHVTPVAADTWTGRQVTRCLISEGIIPHEAWREAAEEDRQRARQSSRAMRLQVSRDGRALVAMSKALDLAWHRRTVQARRSLIDVAREFHARAREHRNAALAEAFEQERRECWPIIREMLSNGSRYDEVAAALNARGPRKVRHETWSTLGVVEIAVREGMSRPF